jgi:ABC-type phosphate transport system permease subunit
MTGFGSRVIITAGRLCAWLVVGVPVAVVGVIAFAAMEVRDRPADISYAAPVAMTITIAALAAFIGASLGAALAFVSEEFGWPWLNRVARLVVATLRGIPPVVLGGLGWAIIIPPMFGHPGTHAAPPAWQAVSVAVTMLTAMLIAPAFGATMHALQRIPAVTREAAAAAGATRPLIAAAVLLPLVARTLWAAMSLGFARAAGEATAVTLIFLALAFDQRPLGAVLVGASLHGVAANSSNETLVLLGQASAAGLVLIALGFAAVSAANRFDRNIVWV